MELRRATTRESRRRRVLVDEVARELPADRPRNPKRRAPRYQPEALRLVHRSLAHLVPLRTWTVTLIVAVGMTLNVAAVNLHLFACDAQWRMPADALLCFDITRRDSFAGWLNVAWWSIAVIYTIAAYSMRSHRMNDYRGTYRIWIPAIALLVAAQIDSVAGISRLFVGLAVWLDANHHWRHAPQTLAVAVPLILAVPACRLLWDMAESKALMALTAVSLAATLAGRPLELVDVPSAWAELWEAGLATLALVAHFGLALAAVLVTRRMYLDASNQLRADSAKPGRQQASAFGWSALLRAPAALLYALRPRWPFRSSRRDDETDADEDDDEGKRSLRIHRQPPKETSQGRSVSSSNQPASRPELKFAARGDVAGSDASDRDGDDNGLSRSERRRLRKEKRRHPPKAA